METGWAILETVPDPMYTARATKKSKKSSKGNKDACYHEAKRKFKVFPSAYASGYIAKCRKKKGSVKKSDKGSSLKRWYKEDWRDEKGDVCGSSKNKNTKKCRPRKRVTSKTPVTWTEMSPTEKKRAVKEKKKVGMGKRTSKVKSKK
jgi:hypothetical protein